MKKALIIFLMLILVLQFGCSGKNSSSTEGDSSNLSTSSSEEIDVSKYSYKDYYKKALDETKAVDDIIYISNDCIVMDKNFKLKSVTTNAMVSEGKGQSGNNISFGEGIIEFDKSGINFNKIQTNEYANEKDTGLEMTFKQYSNVFESLDLEKFMPNYLSGEPNEYYITFGQDYNAINLTSDKINIKYLKLSDNVNVSEFTPTNIDNNGTTIDGNDYIFITPYYLFATDCSYVQGGSLPSGIGAVNKHWYDESANKYVWENANNIICVCFNKTYKK